MSIRLIWGRQTLPLNRIEIFSDSVFAIIITLLVLEIKLPELETANVSEHLTVSLFYLLPKIVSYIISFITVAIFWVSHYHLFNHMKHSDHGLLWLNNLLLLFLAFIPFPTGLIGSFPGEPLAVVLYGLVLFLSSLNFYFIRFYAYKKHLYQEKHEKHECAIVKKGLIPPVMYLIGMLFGSMRPVIGILIFAIVPAAYLLTRNIEIKRG